MALWGSGGAGGGGLVLAVPGGGGKGGPLSALPAPIWRGCQTSQARSRLPVPSELASSDRGSPAKAWLGRLHTPCALAPYAICRVAEQNFLINKQDLGFHVGEAMTEEGLGLSLLSAPGPANSLLPGRA